MKLYSFVLLMLLNSGIACQHESTPPREDNASNKPGIIYHSFDKGETWEDISTGLPNSLRLQSLSFHEGELWLGASDGLYRGTRYISETVWEKVPVDVREVSGLAPGKAGRYLISFWHGIFQELPGTGMWTPIHQHLPDLLVNSIIETPEGTILAGCESGIYRSDNHGESWTHVYTSTRIINFTTQDGVLIAGSIAGIFRSSDDGKNWDRTLHSDLEASRIRPYKDKLVGLIEKDPPVRGVRDRALYISSDSGLTWIPLGVQPPGAIYNMVVAGNCIYIVASTGIYRSDDMCEHWIPVNPATTKEDVLKTLISTGDELYLFVNSSGGC